MKLLATAPARAARRWSLMALTAAAALTLPSCVQDKLPEPNTPLTHVARNSSEYVGHTTTVEGVVRYRFTPGVFVIGPEGNWPTKQQRMLVIASGADFAETHEGQLLRVGGVVRVVNRQTFATDFGLAGAAALPNLDDNFFGEWDGRPALVAQEIDVLPRQDKPPVPPPAPATQPATAPSGAA